jgi:hypothetical protein
MAIVIGSMRILKLLCAMRLQCGLAPKTQAAAGWGCSLPVPNQIPDGGIPFFQPSATAQVAFDFHFGHDDRFFLGGFGQHLA